MKTLYFIVDYDRRYRPKNTHGQEYLHAPYVKLPIKPRGTGLKKLIRRTNCEYSLMIWPLLLQISTEGLPHLRGFLLNNDDEPATVREIAESISLESHLVWVQKGLRTLVNVGWVGKAKCLRFDYAEHTERLRPKLTKTKLKETKLNKAKGDSSFLNSSDLAKYHISVCPAPKAVDTYVRSIRLKFFNLIENHGLEMVGLMVREFSPRSKTGDGMGMLMGKGAVWMESKMRNETEKTNNAKDDKDKAEREEEYC